MSRAVKVAEITAKNTFRAASTLHFGVIGGTGNLGGATTRRLLNLKAEGHLPRGDILISGQNPEKLRHFQQLGVRIVSNQELMETCDVAFGCLKPAVAPVALKEAPSWKRPTGSVYVPFAAASTPESTAKYLGSGRGLVNGMTGLAVELGMGSTFLCAHPDANENERLLAEYASGLLGDVYWLNDNESHKLHLATSIVGCSPAYFAYVVEAVQKKAQELGIEDPAIAEQIVRSTMLSTGQLMAEKNIPAAGLIERVATKGGVTRGGIEIFDAANTSTVVGDVVEANVKRCEAIADTLAAEAKPASIPEAKSHPVLNNTPPQDHSSAHSTKSSRIPLKEFMAPHGHLFAHKAKPAVETTMQLGAAAPASVPPAQPSHFPLKEFTAPHGLFAHKAEPTAESKPTDREAPPAPPVPGC